MLIYSLLPFFTAIYIMTLGLFVYFNNRKSVLNITLFAICCTGFIWLMGYVGMYLCNNETLSVILAKTLYVAVIFIPVFYHHFTVRFINKNNQGALIRISYIVAFVFVFLDIFSNTFIVGVHHFYWGYQTKAGPLHSVFLIFSLAIFVKCLMDLHSSYTKNIGGKSKAELNRNRIVFFAFLLANTASIDFIPNYGIAMYPFGNINIAVFTSIIAYAIIRHQLLDIEVIIKKTLVFAGLFALISALLITLTLVIQEFLLIRFRIAPLCANLFYLCFGNHKIDLIALNFSLSYLISSAIFIFLGLFVYVKNRNNPLNIRFALYSISIGWWALFSALMINAHSAFMATLWDKLCLAGAILVPSAFLHFLFAFLRYVKRNVIRASYLIALVFLASLPSHFFVKHIEPKDNVRYFTHPGFLYAIFIGYFIVVLAVCIYLIFIAIKTERHNPTKKQQLIFLFWTSIFGYVGGVFTFLFVYDLVNVFFASLGNYLIAVYGLTLTYIIFKYQFLNIDIIIKKTLVFAGLLVSVFSTLMLPTLLMQEYILRSASAGSRLLGLTISGIIIILTMRKIETFLINITDKYLFQKKYDYKELLKTFTTEVLTILELDKLIDATVNKLKDIMRLDSCKVILFDEDNGWSADYSFIGQGKSYLLYKGNLIISLGLKNNIKGVLSLGRKRSDEEYTQDDLDILLPLARTLAIAISNAQLFVELGQTQAEAAQKEKMAVIGTLAAGMAHEIRNPITTIKIFTEYLPEKLKDESFRNKYKGIVIKEVDKIDHIIQTMVDFSGDTELSEPSGVSLKEAIDDLIGLINLTTEAREKINFITDIPSSLSKIRVNRKELDEILLNVSQNAIHAIEGEGSITFKVTEDKNFIQLYIKDTGCGMSREVCDHIFDPFFTTRSKGYGLGLFIVNELVKRNKGKISVQSKSGEGTQLNLEFKKI